MIVLLATAASSSGSLPLTGEDTGPSVQSMAEGIAAMGATPSAMLCTAVVALSLEPVLRWFRFQRTAAVSRLSENPLPGGLHRCFRRDRANVHQGLKPCSFPCGRKRGHGRMVVSRVLLTRQRRHDLRRCRIMIYAVRAHRC